MKNELILFETARLAKEKGFNSFTDCCYNESKSLCNYRLYNDGSGHLNKAHIGISAPTQSLLQRWLREQHNIHLWIHPIRKFDNPKIYFDYIILDRYNPTNFYKTYEEALEIGLQEALKLISKIIEDGIS